MRRSKERVSMPNLERGEGESERWSPGRELETFGESEIVIGAGSR